MRWAMCYKWGFSKCLAWLLKHVSNSNMTKPIFDQKTGNGLFFKGLNSEGIKKTQRRCYPIRRCQEALISLSNNYVQDSETQTYEWWSCGKCSPDCKHWSSDNRRPFPLKICLCTIIKTWWSPSHLKSRSFNIRDKVFESRAVRHDGYLLT